MTQAIRLRIYCDGHDRVDGEPLEQAVVHLLWREHAAGVTAIHASEGFGVNRHLHGGRGEPRRTRIPILLEWLDTPERHAEIWPQLEPLIAGVLVTRETIEVLAWPGHDLRHLDLSATVDEVMNRDVVTVRVESPLTEVVGVMVDRGLRFVPVLDGPQLVGVITNGDLVQRAGLALRLELHESTQSVPDPTWAGGTARDVMTDEPTAVLAGTKITDVARLMLHRGIKRIPVLHQARVVGIVSRFDILRTVADDLTNGTAPAIPSGPVTVIGQLAQGRVPAVLIDAPLTRILDVLAGTRLNQAVVIDAERHVVGLVSDADLLRRVGPTHRGVIDRLMRRGGQVAPSSHTAADLMTPTTVVVRSSTPVTQAIHQMMSQQVKILPIVDDDDRLVGIIDRSDALRALFPPAPGSGTQL